MRATSRCLSGFTLRVRGQSPRSVSLGAGAYEGGFLSALWTNVACTHGDEHKKVKLTVYVSILAASPALHFAFGV